jgi:hypothetical protein
MDGKAKMMMTATGTHCCEQVLTTTKRKGSHDNKTMGWDDTNTDNKGADDDRDWGMKTNDEEEDSNDKGPSNQDNRNRKLA